MKGAEGEYYFHPQKPVQLKGPPGTVGKARTIPIFIHSNVLVSLCIPYGDLVSKSLRWH